MKKLFFYILTVIVLGLEACRKDSQGPSKPLQTIYQLVRADSARFTILQSLLTTTHVSDTLLSQGSYTLFAPTDSAFLQSGITLDSLNHLTAGVRLQMAKYYVSQIAMSLDSFPAGWEKPALQMGLSHDNYQPNRYAWLTLQSAKNQYYVNGVPLVQGGIPAVNGVLHIIGGTLEHTSTDLSTTLATDSRFSYGVNFANSGFSNAFSSSKFQSQNDTVQMTVFYPDSTSWANAPYLDPFNSNHLVYPDYSTVNQVLFEPDFYDLNQREIVTNLGTGNSQYETLTFLLNPDPSVLGQLNVQPANIRLSSPVIVTTNGIIYFVDQCLASSTY